MKPPGYLPLHPDDLQHLPRPHPILGGPGNHPVPLPEVEVAGGDVADVVDVGGGSLLKRASTLSVNSSTVLYSRTRFRGAPCRV